MTTYFYGRNSDVESYEKGSSIDTQLSKVKSYCNIKNLKVDIEITEQISGTVPFKRRPQGYELWKSLKNNDQIICSHLDRFSRNTLDLLTLVEEFKRKKIKLHFVDVGGEVTGSDSISSVFIKMLSVFAEFYSKQQSEKSKATKQRMIKENKYTGGFRPKFGYDVDDNGYLVPCEKEQSIIRLMKLLRKKGKSYKQISEIVTKSTRKKFVQSWVFNILKRESSIPPNDNITIHNICNVELQPTIADV
jgi:DNA invertase Pin-like site-specific DNA recombinase